MTSGLLFLAAGELATAMRELERWNPATCSRKEAKTVAGLLRIGIYRSEAMLRKYEARVGNVQTVKVEAQDIEEGDKLFFPKLDRIEPVTKITDSPVEPGFLRITLAENIDLDVDPSEEFAVVISE